METEVKATVSSGSGTTLKYTIDGKAMDLTDRKNRCDAVLIFIAAMSLLDAVYAKDEKETKEEE